MSVHSGERATRTLKQFVGLYPKNVLKFTIPKLYLWIRSLRSFLLYKKKIEKYKAEENVRKTLKIQNGRIIKNINIKTIKIQN